MIQELSVRCMRAAVEGAKLVLPSGLQRLARAGLHAMSQRAYRPRTVSRDVFGSRISILLSDRIAQSWYDRDVGWLPSFRYLIEHRAHRYQMVFYIGAHHCVYGIALSRALPTAQMLAIEANPEHSKVAKANLELNGHPKVAILTAAIADFDGELEFTYGHSVALGDAGIPTRRVPARTVDGVARQYGSPGLIILDVEGYEGQALSGAAEALQSDADWCIEVHCGCGLERYGGSLAAVIGCFPCDEFHLLMSQDFGNSPVVPLDLKSPLVSGRFHLLALRR